MRVAVFLLGALPFWAIAQDSVIPPVIPTAISDYFVDHVINTPIETPPQPSNDPGPTTDGVPDAPQTTSELPVDLRTTSELPLDIDTTASVPLGQETSTPVVETSTGIVSTSTLSFVLDTTSKLVDETLKPEARKSKTTSQIGLEENKTTEALLAKTTAAEEPAGQPPIIVPPPDNNDENSTNEVSRSVEQPVTTEPQPGTLEPTSEAITPGTEPAAAVTAPPVTEPATTTAPQDSTSIVLSISSQVNNLTPKIDRWKQDPEALKDETNKDVQDTHDDVIAAIVLLGGSPAIPCVPNPMGIINQLACAASGLTAASSAIIAGNVPAVSSAMSGVENNFKNSTDDDSQNSEEGKDENEDKTEEASTKLQETTEEPYSQPAATTVRQPTSLENLTSTTSAPTETPSYQPCAMGTCDQGDSCSKPSKQNPEDFRPKCPTNRPESTSPDKRQLEPRYPDHSDSAYFLDLSPVWLSFEYAAVTGYYFEYPDFGDASFGIKGLYGCTAVFIVSSQGVYLAHIYEDPVFIHEGEVTEFDDFYEQAIDGLVDGNDHATSVRAFRGTDDDPGPLHQSHDPLIIVVPPLTPENQWGERLPTMYQYEQRARRVASELAELIYDDEDRYEVLGYTRTIASIAESDGSIWGRAVLEVDTVSMRWRIWIDGVTQREKNYGFDFDKRQDAPISNKCLVTSQQPPTTLSTSVIPPPPAPTEAPAPAAPQPADPVQTDGNNKGSSMCHSIDDACNRAINSFRDDMIYTQFASYYAIVRSSIFSIGSCVVEFDCSDWSIGAMNGKQIKDAYHHLMETSDVSRCGTAYLSNSCHVTANYCYDCHEKHQDIPDSGSHGWGFRY